MRAISSMATRHALVELGRAAVAAGLPELELESVGGVTAAGRISDGEPFDLVFLAAGALAKLAAAGHVLADTVRPLLVSNVAAAVPGDGTTLQAAGSSNGPAFADSAALQSALLASPRIGYSTGPSGDALVRMIDEWGLSGELGGRLVQARPGVPVGRLLADGEVDLGFQQLSELMGESGVRVLGVLPPDCAISTTFSGAVAAACSDPAAARSVLDFFASAETIPLRQRHWFATP